MTNKKLLTALIGLVILPAAVLALAGCTSASSPSARPTASAGALSPADYQAAFDKCMTSQGAGPTHGTDAQGNQTTTVTSGEAGSASAAAGAYCQKKLGKSPGLTFAQSPENKAKGLATAKCLRENGFDVPDPTSDGISQMPVGASPEILAKCGISDQNSTVIVNGK